MQNENSTAEETRVYSKAKEAEKQELEALEGLLAKAQKAREIQTKIDEAAAKAYQKKKPSKKLLPVTAQPPAKQSTQQTAKQSLSKTSKPAPKHLTAARKPAAQKPVVKTTYSASYGKSPLCGPQVPGDLLRCT